MEDEIVNPVPADERVPFLMWGSVLMLTVIIVMGVQFGQNVGITLLGGSAPIFRLGARADVLGNDCLWVPVQFHWL